ncbi:ABC transporter, putative [Ixodes scapularis]|uniref:ABC transporter, putative n=1 Tax=Ixodes scapularis TaxID=6945 RepID=B7QN89_IXOSC|nr:ABC transporter, putative [Ixodes scapularis]|eukprot:XP_002400792.1 ABC transporter, putative [Ixodes scapularis]
MSVQSNILYGKPMQDEDYGHVLGACQLHEDINTFPAGDLTEVGEKGETLSGGQKQRISLARAVYSQSDIYLLDDPLSALDAVVSKKVFNEVIGKDGILKGKTRIMACNQGSFLDQMDTLVLVHDRRVVVYDSLEDLLNDPGAPETLRQGAVSNAAENNNNDGEGMNGRVTVDEDTESTKSNECKMIEKECTNIAVLTNALNNGVFFVFFFRPALAGPCLPIGLLAFVASAVALGWQLNWMKTWTSATSGIASTEPLGATWMRGLLALCVSDVLCRILGSFLLAVAMRCLSRSLHREMLGHILSSPVPFFESTPRGRIVNRFSVDLDFMDTRLYLNGKQCIQVGLLAIARLAIISTQSLFVLAVGVVCTIFVVASTVICTLQRSMSRLQFVSLSTLLSIYLFYVSLLSDSSNNGCHKFVDVRSPPSCGVLRALRRLHRTSPRSKQRALWQHCLCGFIVILTTMLFVVLLPPWGVHPDPSSVGLTLSAASSILQTMVATSSSMFAALQAVVSFERCVDYTELPQEPGVEAYDDLDPEHSKLSEWPPEGKVEFVSYAASYKPGILPDVLKGITFTVNPTEKVGVVGRTGAGKSSLVMALLRVLKSSQGCIRIDGRDIAQVHLKKLRSGITVIPQDPQLVRGTLRENLDPTGSHTDDEIWTALEQAHLKDVVAKDPKRLLLDTGDGGSSFSVGERQLVCLVRALLRKPRLLVLDEATSQMDGDTDQLIQATLREAFAQCTQITIAHRIHTVLDHDKILVMSDGCVLEYGTVEDLLSNPSSVFRNMARDALIQTDSEKPTKLLAASRG